jgi:CheY-like chemotaxis protein
LLRQSSDFTFSMPSFCPGGDCSQSVRMRHFRATLVLRALHPRLQLLAVPFVRPRDALLLLRGELWLWPRSFVLGIYMPTGPLILCIDDNEIALRIRRLVLERNGYRVLTSTEMAKGFDLFASHPVDLVITDHLLNESTAAELIHRMKQVKPEVPVMLFSGAAEVPEIEGMDMFVSKLEPTEVVLSKIACLLAGPNLRHAA